MQRLEDTSTPLSVALAIIGYSLCSSTMLLANKLAMAHLPLPSVVSFIQILFATIIIAVMKVAGVPIDTIDNKIFKAYLIYTAVFVLAIYTNMQALSMSNVETVIVFRACSPIAVSVVEYFFMNRDLPSLRSASSLGIVAVGAILYCLSDSQLALGGFGAYSWATLYLIFITIEMTYGKQITSTVKMNSVWAPVLYCNAFAAVPMFMLGYVKGDYEGITEKLLALPFNGHMILLFSCVTGTLIGYTSWLCRGMTSATTFTLVGVINKFLTVLLNVLVWDKHSSAVGITAVCLCLLAGTFYQQAPRRDIKHKGKGSGGEDVVASTKEPLLEEEHEEVSLLARDKGSENA